MRWAALLVVAGLALGACDDGEPESEATLAPTSAPPTSGQPDALERCPQAPQGSSQSSFDAASGTYAATVTAVDPAAGSVSFDVLQWLVGPDAVAAFQADNPGESEGPPNDYYIVNANDEVRTAPATAATSVLLVRLATDSNVDLTPGTLDELPAYLADTPGGGGLYWLTFDGGQITEICEQYTP